MIWLTWRALAVEPLTVFAASSLTDVLPEVASDWTAIGNPPVVFSFDASSRLARQVQAGAPADVLVSADRAWMDVLAGEGLVDPASRRILAGNALVVVVPAGAASISDAAALTDPRFTHVAVAAESAPAGAYARASLTALGVWDDLSGKVVTGDNVRTTLAWVRRGEAEAGVVFATDARGADVGIALVLDPTTHPVIEYPGAVVAASDQSAEAASFLEWCAGPGQATFRAAGFLPPPVR